MERWWRESQSVEYDRCRGLIGGSVPCNRGCDAEDIVS